jgi:hypothetical protein
MPLTPIPCPHPPQLMVVVCSLNDENLGAELMEALSPDDRVALFQACRWLAENPEWDRWTYQVCH